MTDTDGGLDMSSIAADPNRVKARLDPQASTQEYRKYAAAFADRLAAGRIPGTPPARIVADHRREAVVVTEAGERHPVRSWWVRSRLAVWCDHMIRSHDVTFGGNGRAGGRVVTPLVIGRIIMWLIADAWLAAEAGVDRG